MARCRSPRQIRGMVDSPAGLPGRASVWVPAALIVVLAILAGIVLSVQWAAESRAEQEYAALRASHVPDSLQELGALDPRLREASGLALASGGTLLWSHNDSGDEARLYLVDRTGTVVSTVDLAGVDAQDWESMEAGPCPGGEGPRCLWVADSGDNVRRRDILTVHVLVEPDPVPGDPRSVEPVGRLRYLYPDGSRDAEAVAVSPAGDFVVVTKGRAPDIRLFHLDPDAVRRAVAADEPVRLDAGTRLPLEPDWDVGRVVTGAAFRADGEVLAVRTLSEIYFYSWPDLVEVAPPCFLGTREPQGEAVTWDSDGALLLTSETTGKGPGMLLRVRCGGFGS